MSDESAVLSANEAFYAAFDAGDSEAMTTLWARKAPVACTHPGWTVIADRDKVLESWAAILDGSAWGRFRRG